MTLRAIEAAVFDMDGVLVDTERDWDASRRAVAERASEAQVDQLAGSAREALRQALGR